MSAAFDGPADSAQTRRSPPGAHRDRAQFEGDKAIVLRLCQLRQQVVERQSAIARKLMIAPHGIPEAKPVLSLGYVTQMNVGETRHERFKRVQEFPVSACGMGRVVGDLKIPLLGEPEQPVRMVECPGRSPDG